MEFAQEYFDRIKWTLDGISEEQVRRIVQILVDARRGHRRVFLFGNGGSAATASHFACDLGKGTIQNGSSRFKVVALTDNVPLITAWANDAAYGGIFMEQLTNLVEAGDVVIGISGSGNSENVVQALHLANDLSATTIAFTGFDGGRVQEIAAECVVVPCDCMEQIEDVHLILCHTIASYIRSLPDEGQEAGGR